MGNLQSDSEVHLGRSPPSQSSLRGQKKKRLFQFLIHPKHPFFTLRPCDARFVFWPGDCWCWKGSTGRLKLCNKMTHRLADVSSLLLPFWRFRPLFVRHGRVHDGWGCLLSPWQLGSHGFAFPPFHTHLLTPLLPSVAPGIIFAFGKMMFLVS